MRYLCLIYFDEQKLADMPPAERNALNAAHLDFNDSLRESGHFLIAEALDPPSTGTSIRMRDGRPIVTDGPYAETKEMLAGFYVIEARDMQQAAEIASRLPAMPYALRVDVRPACQLTVEGREPRWG